MRILTAMIISDGEEEEEIVLEANDPDEKAENTKASEPEEKTELTKSPIVPPAQDAKSDKPNKSNSVLVKDPKDVCHFYTINKC